MTNGLTVPRTGEAGVIWCRFRSQKGNSGYKLTPSAGGWSYTSLHDFDLGSDGGLLYGSVALDANGNVFGVTGSGPYPFPDDGVLFEITQ